MAALLILAAFGLAWPTSAQALASYQRLRSFKPDEVNRGTPQTRLIEGSDGLLYGSTSDGEGEAGVIFRMKKDGNGFTVLYQTGTRYPLLEGSDGALYGILAGEWDPDGFYIGNTITRLSKTGGSLIPLTNVSVAGGLIEGDDGALYGVGNGGTNGLGRLFKLWKDGTHFTVLHDFSGDTDGANPAGALLKGSDGTLYGTTLHGGTLDYGTVFKIEQDGSAYRVLHATGGVLLPQGELVEGDDGMLYGTMSGGGEDGVGALFRLRRDGSDFIVLRGFSDTVGDGRYPAPGLARNEDGSLTGVAGGGAHEAGMLFKYTPESGRFEVLYDFGAREGDGVGPSGPPVVSSDGAWYGMTSQGGGQNVGVIYKVFHGPARTALQSLELTGSGGLLHVIGGAAGQSYAVQATTQLGTVNSWIAIGSGTADIDGQFRFLDPDAALFPIRFYQVVAP